MRKLISLTVAGALALVFVWLVGSRVAQGKRDSAYRTAVAKFQHDLPLGTPKAAVQEYLHSRNIDYYAAKRGGSRVVAYEIKIGEDSGAFVCEPWDVYVALEFSTTDVLERLHMSREQTCL
jgi:hypothetical protein